MMAPYILLINPNSSQATTGMMHAIAERTASGRIAVASATAISAPSMIVTAAELEASAAEVVALGLAHAENDDCRGIVVSAYGDPGVEALRQRVTIPVTGICEASMLAASANGRRFSVATVTPDLLDAIAGHATRLGLSHLYAGARCSTENPRDLASDPEALRQVLERQVRACILEDHAEAVIIGGGPLGQAADQLKDLFDVPVFAPIPCAVEQLIVLLPHPLCSGVDMTKTGLMFKRD